MDSQYAVQQGLGALMEKIIPGRYKHYKGNVYEVIAAGTHTETGEKVVIYKSEKGDWWVRPEKVFLEDAIVDGKKIPRFERL